MADVWPTRSSCDDAPVTVFARHQVLPGKKPVFEAWARGITEASARYPGYMGTEVVRPSETQVDDYVIIFRFDTKTHLEAWLHSADRKPWLDRVTEFSEVAPTLDYHSLEFWFSPDTHGGRAPSKHKMALVTFTVIWPLVHFVPRFVAKTVPVPSLGLEVISVGLIVLLMTYAVMPTVTRVFRAWLFAQR